MNKYFLHCVASLALFCAFDADAARHYVGGDISLLPEYKAAGAVYKDHSGRNISDLLAFFKDEGMNAMRVRLFVNPERYNGADKDPNACQDLDYIIPLCKDIVEHGYDLMLDFHYSDTWADPAKQWTPDAWKNLSDDQLYDKIYEYTREVLATLKENGITPAFIQPGNEISYGMLWGPAGASQSSLKKCFSGSDANWQRFGRLLNQAIKACREECPDAKIVIHTERASNTSVQRNFYNWMKTLNVDYDIIGLSYYPYFHGSMEVLDAALSQLEQDYPEKNIMIVETGYSYKWEVPGTDHDLSSTWPYTDAGQNKFATDLVATLEKHPAVDGLFWWWMEYNAYGTKLSNWYNAPLFDSTNGKATSALSTICSFADGNDSSVGQIELTPDESPVIYNLQGIPVSNPGAGNIYIMNGKKVMY